ncbi:hypothetical protein [Vibrio metoecus]|uniref:hypothetical protein n=1 Tax=Vibrio metoecus TaxID=1481663 RepID=UPI00272C1423|nr:hypothetical protein [Vibrio metoecus]WKY93732.1 hypothetical protein QYQ96_03315 [Vibrio metoecus]
MMEYQLTQFASLFEVAVGINLVFSIWETLRNQAITRYDTISLEMEKAISAVLGEKYEDSRTATEFAEKKTKYLNRLKAISTIGKFSGLTLTVCLIGLLAYLGFTPNFSLQGYYVYIFLFFSVAFSPLFLLLGNLYTAYSQSRLKEFKDQHTKVFLDLKDCVN